METVIAVVIISFVILMAVYYVYRSKKRGEKCIGCPYSKKCNGNCDSKR